MHKHTKTILALTLVLVLSLLAGCGTPAPAAPAAPAAPTAPATPSTPAVELPKVINIGTQQMPNDENIAKALGYFEELGVEVNLLEFDSGSAVVSALASGSLDLGLMGSTPATTAIVNDIGVELIWVHGILGEAEALAVKNDSGYNTVADLAGAKIGVPFGSTGHYSLLSALELNNVATADVTILDMQPADIYAAWQRGDINAAYVWDPTLGNLLQDGKVIISSADLAAQGAITADTEVVRKEFGAKYPELIAGYIKQLSRAQDLYKNDFSEAVQVLADYFQITPEDAERQAAGNVWLTAQDQLGSQYLGTTGAPGDLALALKNTADFLEAQKSIAAAPDLAVFQQAINPLYIELSLK